MLRLVSVAVKRFGGRTFGAALCVSSLLWTAEAASKKVRQPTRDDLATVWVGGLGESLEFYRLELDVRGIGLLTVQDLPDGPVAAYKVGGTALSGYAVTLETTPIEAAEPLQIRGEATPTALRLEVRGRAADWTRRVELQRHDRLLKRINAVTEKAVAVRAVSK